MPKGRPRRKCFVPKVKQHLESRAYYVPELSKDPHARCCFCLTDVQDPLHFGPFFRTETFSVHYLCMLTAGNIVQRDPDGEAGLAGFMPEDILRERARAYMLHCRICGKRGATMGCRGNSKERCRMTYHYACAIANDFGVCFFEDEKQSFSSYCPTHKVLQEKLLSKDISSVCTLCYEDVFPSATSSIEYPCCRNGYAHVECLRRYAFNSGLDHFECPLCKNKALFRDTCQRYGSIFLPEHNVPVWFADADDELLDRGPSECIAIKCSAPEGRKVDKLSGKWCLLPCFTCGHVAMHAACCGNQLLVGSKKKYYQCELCKELIGKEQEERRKSLDPFRKYPFIQDCRVILTRIELEDKLS